MSYQAKYRLLVFSVLSAIALFNSCKVASPTESKKTEIPPPLTVYRPPGAPANLKAKATSLSTIEVDWTDTSHIATWFVIERENIADSSWQIVDSTLGSVTAYIDAGLLCDNTYDYRVYGDNNIGRSISSNIAHATRLSIRLMRRKADFTMISMVWLSLITLQDLLWGEPDLSSRRPMPGLHGIPCRAEQHRILFLSA